MYFLKYQWLLIIYRKLQEEDIKKNCQALVPEKTDLKLVFGYEMREKQTTNLFYLKKKIENP